VADSYITESGYGLGLWVANNRYTKDKLTLDRFQRLEALGFAWDALKVMWEQGFQELVVYKEEFGNCLVADSYITESSYRLGLWVATQRARKDRLSLDRIQRLDGLGFAWDALKVMWEQGFQELVVYKEEFGNCLVADSYITESEHRLGRWVTRQRSRRVNLLPEHIERLDALGFVWDPLDAKWEQGLQELTSYRETFGDCYVTSKHIALSGYPLGKWVSTQRGRKERLVLDRIQRLDILGFVWDPHEAKWEQGFQELVCYKKQFGNCRVPTKYTTDSGFALGGWISRQRANRDKLRPDYFERLDALGFIWKRD